jgi:dihydrofolate reductase
VSGVLAAPTAQRTLAPLCLVAAVAKNRVIGKDGKMPWHLPEDLKHFRRVTLDHAVIMGRLTFVSMGKPLPKRRNIVVTRTPQTIEGCEVVTSLEAAIALARTTDEEPRVIGGGQLYALALPLATRLILTEVQQAPEGDAFFPDFDERDFIETERREGDGVIYRTLDRRS